VKARIVQLHGLSAHADREQLLKWLTGLKQQPRRVFIVHGEAESAEAFAEFVTEKTGWRATVPDYRNTIVLE
jgi:metallo-beta-lactamase family protein